MGWPDQRRCRWGWCPSFPGRRKALGKFHRRLEGRLHPHHAACASMGFQRRNRCRVGVMNSADRIIPVTDNYSIIAEVNRRQICWCKLSISMPVSNDGVLNKGRAPRIVRLEQREVVRSGLTDSKRVLTVLVASCALRVFPPTPSQPRANQQPAALPGRCPRIRSSP